MALLHVPLYIIRSHWTEPWTPCREPLEDVMLTIFCLLRSDQPGYLQKLLPGSAPVEPEALEDILAGTD